MPSAKPLKLVNAQLQVLRAKLRADDWEGFAERLHAIRGMGFDGQPAVIDLAGLSIEQLEAAPWPEILGSFRAVGLRPFAITGVDDGPYQAELALRLGLAKVDSANLGVRMNSEPAPPRETDAPAAAAAAPGPGDAAVQGTAAVAAPEESVASAAPVEAGFVESPWQPPMVIKRQVRSGQQIYARQRDLIVLGSVSPGAEVIADGNVACYGTLQGRAIAGASGKADAFIHALDFRPELVAVAGLYMTFESGPPTLPSGRMIQVRLDPDGDRLITEAL